MGHHLLQVLTQGIRRQIAHHLAVHKGDRRHAACTKAPGCEQGQTTIGSGLPHTDSEFRFQRLQNPLPTLDETGSPCAENAGILPCRCQIEVVIEGGNTIDSTERHMQSENDTGQHARFQIAIGILHYMQHLNQGMRGVSVSGHLSLHCLPAQIFGIEALNFHNASYEFCY